MKNPFMKSLALAAFAAVGLVAIAEPKAPKWLVLDKLSYQADVDQTAFNGADALLLTTLVQANKYKCLDRDAYDTAAREQGFGANVQLVPAGYSMRGEIVQLVPTGKTRTIQNTPLTEYIATVSLRANDLRTQQPYEAETLRVAHYCQTHKDMLVHVVRRVALAILMRDYPMYIMDADEDDGELTLSYGRDFISPGEQYEVRRRKAIVDDDTGDTVYKEKTVGVCEVTDVGKNTSTARLVSGKAKVKDVLRFYENAEQFAVPPAAPAPVAAPAPAPVEKEISAKPLPPKKPRIAVAPFFSKRNAFTVQGVTIPTRNWLDDMADHLNTFLTQTDSFKVLDRSFGPEIDRELARIVNDPNASPNDVSRLSNKLAADYLIVAEVTFSDVVSPGTDFATGLPLPPPSTLFAEVRFKCIVAPTTQIAWADVVRLDSSRFGGTAEVFSSNSSATAAGLVMEAIWRRLAPADFARNEAARAAAAKAAEEQQKAAPVQEQPQQVAPQPGVQVGF